ncbi:CDP-alcohol phosphatidyltransferase family protein [candidate division KSB1 bacterium]|nr:CDP-alcohol phosphatidyltransferase family protein [candidate division KSB1 bacterium]
MTVDDADRGFNRIVNIPNAFSVLRIVLIPFMVYYLSLQRGYTELLVICLLMILSDYLDGYFARKLNQITESGKILDPLADKLAIAAIAVGLVLYRDFPLWALILLVLRDIIIVVAGIIVIRKTGVVPGSNLLGKWTVTVYSVLIFVYVMDIDFLKIYVLYLSMIFLFGSLIGYYKSSHVKGLLNK